MNWAFRELAPTASPELTSGSLLVCRQFSPIPLRSAGLFGKACDRSLGAPLAYIEGSTYLGSREPVTA